jgi:hypothetical protein
MADDEDTTPVYNVGDRVVDAWGREAQAAGDEEVGYDSWTAKQLMAEIEKRNSDRDEDSQIVLAGKKKSDAVAALTADDKANEDEE